MNNKFTQIKKVFFAGIGGIGISAIARMFLEEGKEVIGSDLSESEVVYELRDAGAIVKIGQGIDLIPHDADLIVYSIAIENYDPKFFQALKAQKIPIHSYPEMLHVVTEGKYTIAVAGTHGKTTTTAMIGHVLKEAGKDPSMIVGSLLVDEKSNFVSGKSNLFVVEACEYRRSFLNINPKILVITNIEADHLDYYKDLDDIKSAFRELVARVPSDGYIVCNPNDAVVKDVILGAQAQIVNYFHYYTKRGLKIPGLHNQVDASLAAATCHTLGIDDGLTTMYLETFPGTWRRFEFKGELASGAMVYDDYAHHPTEVQATLQAFREIYPHGQKNILVVFQPHLYSRTKIFLDDFAKAFSGADRVIVLPIYAAREENDGSVSSELLAQKMRDDHTDALAVTSFDEALDFIQGIQLRQNQVIVTMGAGEAYKIADQLLNL